MIKFIRRSKQTICMMIVFFSLFVVAPSTRFVEVETKSGSIVVEEDAGFFAIKGVICLLVSAAAIIAGKLNKDI